MADTVDTARPAQLDRRQIEDEIERLINLLDAADPDPDIEDGGDAEMSLGWTSSTNTGVVCLAVDNNDLEDDSEHDEPELGWISNDNGSISLGGADDLEPSLGWTGCEAASGRYPTGWNVNRDLEDEHDGREPDPPPRSASPAKSDKLKPLSAEREIKSVDLASIKGKYALIGEGDCMIPVMRPGEKIVVDPDADILSGDIVVIHLSPERARSWGYSCIVKRLVADLRGNGNVVGMNDSRCVLLEMLNPRRRFFLPSHEIRAMHRLVEVLPGDATETSAGERFHKGQGH